MIVWERIQTIVTLSGQWPTRQKDGSHVRTVHRRNKCKYQLNIKDGKRNCSIHWIVIYPVDIEQPQPDQQLNFTLRQFTGLHVALLVDILYYKTEYKWSDIVSNRPLTEIACKKLRIKIKYKFAKNWFPRNVVRINLSIKGNVNWVQVYKSNYKLNR